MRNKKSLNYDFSNAKIKVKVVKAMPEDGRWVPISVAAQMANYSSQMIRHLYKNEVIGSIKFEKGPVLVNYNDLEENWLRKEK